MCFALTEIFDSISFLFSSGSLLLDRGVGSSVLGVRLCIPVFCLPFCLCLLSRCRSPRVRYHPYEREKDVSLERKPVDSVARL